MQRPARRVVHAATCSAVPSTCASGSAPFECTGAIGSCAMQQVATEHSALQRKTAGCNIAQHVATHYSASQRRGRREREINVAVRCAVAQRYTVGSVRAVHCPRALARWCGALWKARGSRRLYSTRQPYDAAVGSTVRGSRRLYSTRQPYDAAVGSTVRRSRRLYSAAQP